MSFVFLTETLPSKFVWQALKVPFKMKKGASNSCKTQPFYQNLKEEAQRVLDHLLGDKDPSSRRNSISPFRFANVL